MFMRLVIPAMLMAGVAEANPAAMPLRQLADASSMQTPDAAQRAAKDMAVGRYYVSKRDYAAAINRFRTVATEYQSSPDIEEALERMVECYLDLGIIAEAQTAAAILVRKYPDGRWSRAARDLLTASGLEPIEDPKSSLPRRFE
jgi:outer membrane protein assembly factor BamD